MKVLITGGSGFIGRNLKEQLSDEFEIFAPAHAELELLNQEAVDSYFRKNKIDVVVHSATKPGHRNAKDPTNLLDSNTRMYFNLVMNIDRFDKMILLTSGAVYDMRHYQPKMKEDYFGVHIPVDDTGYSKYIIAKHAESHEKIIELRPFGVFGKYEDWQIRFISNMICKALYDLPLTIKQNRKFDYIYIDDLIDIIRFLIMHDPVARVFNATPDHSIELKTLAELVVETSEKKLDIIIKNQGMGVEYSGDSSSLKKHMESISFSPINKSITSLYSWYKRNIDIIDQKNLLFDK
jgi:GDP-L-fucose synthase